MITLLATLVHTAMVNISVLVIPLTLLAYPINQTRLYLKARDTR